MWCCGQSGITVCLTTLRDCSLMLINVSQIEGLRSNMKLLWNNIANNSRLNDQI